MIFTSRKIIGLITFSFIASLALSILISKKLSHVVSIEVLNREASLLFGAIESGPLAIAKLQAASFSQQELERLMATPAVSGRGIVSVDIKGGPNGSYNFASWTDPRSVPSECLNAISNSYQMEQALNPFEVIVVTNSCYVSSEEKSIFIFSSLASILVTFVGSILLISAILPVALSIKEAEQILESGDKSKISKISFVPVENLINQAIKSLELERHLAIVTVAAQVSHDIRSPLSALNMAVSTLDMSSDKVQVIKSAIHRINGIASQLLTLSKKTISLTPVETSSPLNSILLSPVIEAVVAEKKEQYRAMPEIDISFQKSSFIENPVKISENEISRVISNLINNAVEACGKSGKIQVGLSGYNKNLNIMVIDNGKGIPEEVLHRIGERGFTFGKDDSGGHGLGVSHAKEAIKISGGTLSIHSKEMHGTVVTINLPVAKE